MLSSFKTLRCWYFKAWEGFSLCVGAIFI